MLIVILFKLRRIMDGLGGLAQAHLQSVTGIRGGTLSDIINCRSKMIPVSALEAICTATISPIDQVMKFIPKKDEFSFWEKYVQMHKEGQFGNYDWDNNRKPTECSIEWYEDFEDFRAAIDTTLNVGDYATGRRKGLELYDLLLENGLRLTPYGDLLTYTEYYRRYLAPEKHPDDTEYNIAIRTNVLNQLPSFFDPPDVLDRKLLYLGLYWTQHTELFVKDDTDKLIPEPYRTFLENIEKKKRKK